MTTPNQPGNAQGDPAFWNNQQPHAQYSAAPSPYVDPRVTHTSKGRGMSIAAFCLSVATILLVFPFTILSPLPSLVGVPLAAIALKRAGGRDGLAITALVVAAATLVLGIVMAFLFFRAVDSL